MTSSYATLTTNLTRAGYFVDLHAQWHQGVGAPERKMRELPRGAVVFAVGAFDAYLADVVGEVLIARAKAGETTGDARDLMKRIHSQVPGLALELVLDQDETRRIARFQHVIVEELQKTSWFGPTAVGKAMRLLDRPPSGVWDLMKAEGYSDAAAELEDWTSKRHNIVHRSKVVRIQRQSASACIALLDALGRVVDYQAGEAMPAP